MINIIIVDDHAIVRKGLRQIITETPGMTVTAEADKGRDALQLVSEKACDLVILDISLPDMNGLEVLKYIKADQKDLPVLILSMHPEEQYAIRVLNAGADGYLTKDAATEELIEAIRKIAEGGKYVSSSLGERLAADVSIDNEKSLHAKLSDREYQILCMIASGKTATEIAGELFISVKTVSTYRMRLLEKMNMKNNAQLTNYAVKAGLVV